MAFTTEVDWEVRSATGSDTNGGGFDPVSGSPGTDYSQQATAQIAFTDLVIGATTTQATSVLNPFTSAHVGNIINITGGTGFTVQRVLITTVSAGIATCDKSLGTAASTGGTGNLGGALATLSKAVSLAVQNNFIWCKGSETITTTLSLTLTYSGGAGHVPAYTIAGYSTTRGDTGQFTLQSSTNSVHLITYATGAGQTVLSNLIIKSTAGTPGNGIQAGSSGGSYDLALNNCVIDGCNLGVNGPFSGQYFIAPLLLNNCVIKNCVSHGVYNCGFIYALDSYFKSNGGSGLFSHAANVAAEGFVAIGCTFYNNVNGIAHEVNIANSFSAGGLMQNCNFVSNSGRGYLGPGSAVFVTIKNCVFQGNNEAINGGASNTVVTGFQFNNAFRSNTTNRANFVAGVGDITLTADAFTSPSGDDFTLNNTAGGGAALKAAGYQSTVM